MTATPDEEAPPPPPDVVHAYGDGTAPCGAPLTVLPMNFTPPKKRFGTGPHASRGRPWCPDCLRVRASRPRRGRPPGVPSVPVPPDAFARYLALGPTRSYPALAALIGCSPQAIAAHARRDRWQARVREFEDRTRIHVEQVTAETIEQMTARHVAALHEVQVKALDALRTLSMNNAAEAARVLTEAVKLERLARGEASDRVALDVAEMVKRQHQRWLTVEARPVEPVALLGTAADEEEPPPPPPLADDEEPPPPPPAYGDDE